MVDQRPGDPPEVDALELVARSRQEARHSPGTDLGSQMLHAAPAAGHAAAKFLLLAPAVAPAAGVVALRSIQRLAAGRSRTSRRQV
jgi:hypothetical protein